MRSTRCKSRRLDLEQRPDLEQHPSIKTRGLKQCPRTPKKVRRNRDFDSILELRFELRGSPALFGGAGGRSLARVRDGGESQSCLRWRAAIVFAMVGSRNRVCNDGESQSCTWYGLRLWLRVRFIRRPSSLEDFTCKSKPISENLEIQI